MRRPLLIGLSPNITEDDVRLARELLRQPEEWLEGSGLEKVRSMLADRFHPGSAFLFDSGRWSLTVLLRALNLRREDEVVLQAFTCVAVPNAVLWAGGTPVYVDIGDDLNMDARDLLKKITKKTRALIVQHTFGAPAQLDAILPIAKKHRLVVIEDCAHALGGTYKGRPLGSFGDAAILSFGRDKVISSVNGGAAVVYNRTLKEKIHNAWRQSAFPSKHWVRNALNHPMMTANARNHYGRLYLGQVMLWIMQTFGFLERAVFPEEKHGRKPDQIGFRLPNALAELALHQLEKLEDMNRARVAIARAYQMRLHLAGIVHPQTRNEVFLRYPILVDDPDGLRAVAKQQKILLGDWYASPIAPRGTDFSAIGYTCGSCPRAERASFRVVNLPTMHWMEKEDIDRVIRVVKEWHAHH